jgi:hypothetical protein
MAPTSFRDRAKAYLEVAKDANAVSKRDEELKALKAAAAEAEARHRAELDEVNGKLNAVLERLSQPAAKPVREPRPKAKDKKKRKEWSAESRAAAQERAKARFAERAKAREAALLNPPQAGA